MDVVDGWGQCQNDALINEYGLKSAIVVKTIDETNLPIDTNDDLARIPKISFALLDNG